MRNFVRKFLLAYVLTDEEVNQIVLAVDEISANLIIHANHKDKKKYIKLSISYQNGGFLFKFTDQGTPFDLSKYKEPNINEKILNGERGGVGILLVKLVMDKVEFTTDNNGTNICQLYKKIPTTSKSGNLVNK